MGTPLWHLPPPFPIYPLPEPSTTRHFPKEKYWEVAKDPDYSFDELESNNVILKQVVLDEISKHPAIWSTRSTKTASKHYPDIAVNTFLRTGLLLSLASITRIYKSTKDSLRNRIRLAVVKKRMTPEQVEESLWKWECYPYIRYYRKFIQNWEADLQKEIRAEDLAKERAESTMQRIANGHVFEQQDHIDDDIVVEDPYEEEEPSQDLTTNESLKMESYQWPTEETKPQLIHHYDSNEPTMSSNDYERLATLTKLPEMDNEIEEYAIDQSSLHQATNPQFQMECSRSSQLSQGTNPQLIHHFDQGSISSSGYGRRTTFAKIPETSGEANGIAHYSKKMRANDSLQVSTSSNGYEHQLEQIQGPGTLKDVLTMRDSSQTNDPSHLKNLPWVKPSQRRPPQYIPQDKSSTLSKRMKRPSMATPNVEEKFKVPALPARRVKPALSDDDIALEMAQIRYHATRVAREQPGKAILLKKAIIDTIVLMSQKDYTNTKEIFKDLLEMNS